MKIREISDVEYIISDLEVIELSKKLYCIFDFEATGPSPSQDYITQIGACLFNPKEPSQLTTTYLSLVKPNKKIPETIEIFTGITNQDVLSARTFSKVYDEFREFCHEYILVTQAGYEYDIPLLMNECKRNNKRMISNHMLDTKALFTYLHPEVTEIISTNYLIEYYNVEERDIQRHHALADSIIISRIFNSILNECIERGIRDISFQNLAVKKTPIKPLE